MQTHDNMPGQRKKTCNYKFPIKIDFILQGAYYLIIRKESKRLSGSIRPMRRRNYACNKNFLRKFKLKAGE